MTRDRDVKHSAPIESDSGGGVSLRFTPTDKAMLDWMGSTRGIAWRRKSWAVHHRTPELMCLPIEPRGKPTPTFATLREAIADAMLREREKGQK